MPHLQPIYGPQPGSRRSVYREIVQAATATNWQITRIDYAYSPQSNGFVEDADVIVAGLKDALRVMQLDTVMKAISRRGKAYLVRTK